MSNNLVTPELIGMAHLEVQAKELLDACSDPEHPLGGPPFASLYESAAGYERDMDQLRRYLYQEGLFQRRFLHKRTHP